MTFVPGALPESQLERRRDRLERRQARHAIEVLDAIIAARRALEVFQNRHLAPDAPVSWARFHEMQRAAVDADRAAVAAIDAYCARWPR